MLTDSGGGGSLGEGVCCGGEGGGGVGGWGICRNPCLLNWKTLCNEAYVAHSSSLRGGSINQLYSGHFLPLSLNKFPLPLAPNIKIMA